MMVSNHSGDFKLKNLYNHLKAKKKKKSLGLTSFKDNYFQFVKSNQREIFRRFKIF